MWAPCQGEPTRGEGLALPVQPSCLRVPVDTAVPADTGHGWRLLLPLPRGLTVPPLTIPEEVPEGALYRATSGMWTGAAQTGHKVEQPAPCVGPYRGPGPAVNVCVGLLSTARAVGTLVPAHRCAN